MLLQEERERQWLLQGEGVEDADGGGRGASAGLAVPVEGGGADEAATALGRSDSAGEGGAELGGGSARKTGAANAVGWVLKLNMAWLDSMADDEMLQRKAQRDLSNCLSDMSPPVNPR